jgi:hypothetical protein
VVTKHPTAASSTPATRYRIALHKNEGDLQTYSAVVASSSLLPANWAAKLLTTMSAAPAHPVGPHLQVSRANSATGCRGFVDRCRTTGLGHLRMLAHLSPSRAKARPAPSSGSAVYCIQGQQLVGLAQVLLDAGDAHRRAMARQGSRCRGAYHKAGVHAGDCVQSRELQRRTCKQGLHAGLTDGQLSHGVTVAAVQPWPSRQVLLADTKQLVSAHLEQKRQICGCEACPQDRKPWELRPTL